MIPPSAPLPIARLVEGVRAGRIAPREPLEAASAALRAADAGPEPVNAFLATDFEGAAREAERLAEDPRRPCLPLAGVPIAVADDLATLGLPTTCGSLALEGYRSPYEATAVRRLRAAGALVVGKTNLDEFSLGASTERSAYGPTRNPRDRSRVAGGGSGGAAAAVAAGIVPAALASDAGGSARQPAAFCGVVALSPTHGRVSRYGLVSVAPSLERIAALGLTVADAARLLESIAGRDPCDSTSADLPPPRLLPPSGASREPLVVGVPEECFPASLDAGVAAACRAALGALERLGAEIRPVSLPAMPHALPAHRVLAAAEASSSLARFDGVHFGARGRGASSADELYQRTRALLGSAARGTIALGTLVLSGERRDDLHVRAQRARDLLAGDIRGAFRSGVDVLFTPTTGSVAFRSGECLDDPDRASAAHAHTVLPGLAGLPAISLPIGSWAGLPVGGQLIGRAWHEARLVRIATALEGELTG